MIASRCSLIARIFLFAALVFGVAVQGSHAAVFTDLTEFTDASQNSNCTLSYEEFTGLVVQPTTSVNTLQMTLNSGSVVITLNPNQGPNLLGPEVSITAPGFINWNGSNFLGIPDRSLVVFNADRMNVNFTTPTAAAGVFLNAFQTAGSINYSYTATVNAYNAANSLIGTTTITPVSNPTGSFVGFSGLSSNISRLELVRSGNPAVTWSPVLAGTVHCSPNVTAIPEPTSLALCAIVAGGMAVRRRRRRSFVDVKAGLGE